MRYEQFERKATFKSNSCGLSSRSSMYINHTLRGVET